MTKKCFFDLETKCLFEDVDPNYPVYSWSKKESLRCQLTEKLGMACACILDEAGNRFEFEEGAEEKLLEKLNSFDIIIGHNIINFDYFVLKPYDKENIVKEAIKKTLDSFKIIKEKTGQYASLNDLAKLNLSLMKNEESKLIPKLWACGEKQRVKDYCFNDVKLLKKLYELGTTKPIKYYLKEYGQIVGIRELEKPW